jgi:chemotaxis protein MotA
MDFATLLGLFVGIVVIGLAVTTGSDLTMFANLPGFMIVVGGTFAATLIKFPLATCYHALVDGTAAVFRDRKEGSVKLVAEIGALAALAQKDGLLSLDKRPIKNAFLRKGIAMCVDGTSETFIKKVLTTEITQAVHRGEISERIFRAIGELAPAFGLIGTLVGLVQMLTNMTDPSSLGPSMAIALLTTPYGALIASLIALPMAEKLEHKAFQDRNDQALVIDSVLSIRNGEHPRVMGELLEIYATRDRRKSRLDRRDDAPGQLVGIYIKNNRRKKRNDRRNALLPEAG